MLFLQALDLYPIQWNHHNGHFGNVAQAALGTLAPRPAHASIDQVMAYSPSFYKNSALLGRSTAWASLWKEYNDFIAHTFETPSNKATSGIVGVNATQDPGGLWDAYFKDFVAPPPPPPAGPTLRQKLVDQVLLDYKSFMAKPRLGSDDKMRVQRHMDLLNETQKSVYA